MAFHFTPLKISVRKTLNEISASQGPWRTIRVVVKGAATFNCVFEVKRMPPTLLYFLLHFL